MEKNKMQVKVSKTMCDFINENVSHVIGCKCALIKDISPRAYEIYVDSNPYRNEIDYSSVTGKFKALMIKYNDPTALPRYLTTMDLLKVFRSCKPVENEFIKGLIDYLYI